VSQIYDFALKQSGMTVAQYALLNQIRIEPGLSQTELADRAEMDRTVWCLFPQQVMVEQN
jgi:DNA-binding MarR family transcriptional regulator